MPGSAVIRHLNNTIEALLEAHAARDWVTLADVLEHDLAPLMPNLGQVIDALAPSARYRDEPRHHSCLFASRMAGSPAAKCVIGEKNSKFEVETPANPVEGPTFEAKPSYSEEMS